jgi:tol-pal system protein YbgF
MQVVQLLSTLRSLSDSVASLSSRMTRLRAETLADLRGMRQTIDQVQEVSGQSETKLRELRQQIDARIKQAEARQAPPPAPLATNGDTTQTQTPATPVDDGPDPNELYQIGRDQLTRGGNSAARSAFKDLLKRFPDSPLAADAQFYIAESLAAEGTNAAADTAYAGVVSRYADSPRAPTALYKRGVLAQNAKRTTAAKRIYNEVIDKYPSSDEAELARERLRILG